MLFIAILKIKAQREMFAYSERLAAYERHIERHYRNIGNTNH